MKNRRKTAGLLLALLLTVLALAGCAGQASSDEAALQTAVTQESVGQQEEADAQADAEAETTEAETTEAAPADAETVDADGDVVVRVGSLKGPTSMGIVKMMKDDEDVHRYDFTMETAADTLLGLIVQGKLDIALVPANVAAILYQKTEGAVSVLDINTLGVLYMVSGDTQITGFSSLEGKTIYLTGKGTTPDYVLQYLLAEAGVNPADVTLEYKSEATEVAAILAENPDAVGLLPQPFVTVACMQNEQLSVVLDLTEQWDLVQEENGSRMVTGVTVVTREFLENHPQLAAEFMEEHKASAAYVNENVSDASQLVAEYGIIEKAPVAEKAIPKCNITYIDGEDMKQALSGYLNVLYSQDASSVGGALPGDNFYYIAQ